MIAAMAKAPLPRFTESAINELFTARIFVKSRFQAIQKILTYFFVLMLLNPRYLVNSVCKNVGTLKQCSYMRSR